MTRPGDLTDQEWWEPQRALQQAATDAAREAYRPRLAPNLAGQASGGHVYLSTACWHGLHDKCDASCHWCHAPCHCKCHNDETRR